ncbi:DUF3231 family protein [Lentibacillus amyloliquefaciens]|uniref:Uncharacterized protein n=1 Tax=Lentibacillus amyloliquefaciens TaxID=1472767 RepID=A0A0U4FH36_9BACI|nr:DUF3231 family protein [Lentibacillus amyloliquefaciens]ALX49821.1 hypothetical protein AOX59_15340 [Lentibacillus amyloliquefaciens]
MNEGNIRLTSAEIGSLWTGYMQDSMAQCVLSFMLKHIEDQDIKPAIQYAYDLSSNHLEQLRTIFEKENYAVPNGFTEQDINMNAPWLFTDTFCLSYVSHMTKVGMIAYSGFISMSAREDIRNYFTQALNATAALYNQTTDIALSKGINARHPYIEVPKETDYVDSKKYFSGLNPFSDKRSLNAVEISHLYTNTFTNTIGAKLCLAFAQTSPSKEIQDFMLRLKEISQKHVKIFIDTLMKDDIEAPHVPDLAVSDSTTQTFSDKLLMYHMSLLSTSGIGNYATAAASSQRSDLMINYERLSLEVARIAKSGADIMIKHEWLEQPPGISDRKKLAKNKQKG